MSAFDTKENIKLPIDRVGYWYDIDVVNLGMTGTLEDNAKKVFRGHTLDEVLEGMKQTKLKKFEKLFNGRIWYWVGDFKIVWWTGWRLRRWLRKWVRKRYITDPDDLYTDTTLGTKCVYIYNGEVIEMATGACFMIRFIEKRNP